MSQMLFVRRDIMAAAFSRAGSDQSTEPNLPFRNGLFTRFVPTPAKRITTKVGFGLTVFSAIQEVDK
ncbi:hypothetical protein DLM45_07000 [Hyphomicrobium methylovorum]|nr:hypothetical protein [Hyphomicrobium methylovorum]